MLKTMQEAENYVANILELTGNQHLIFEVPRRSAAWNMGYRFGTCLSSEREAYKADGAVFV